MKSASSIIQDHTPVQSGADSHAAGVTLLTATIGVISVILGGHCRDLQYSFSKKIEKQKPLSYKALNVSSRL